MQTLKYAEDKLNNKTLLSFDEEWKALGMIIDGHNRYAIAQKHGLDFTVKEMQFDNKDAAISCMIYHQFGRRNLSIYDRVCLALKLKPHIETDDSCSKFYTAQ